MDFSRCSRIVILYGATLYVNQCEFTDSSAFAAFDFIRSAGELARINSEGKFNGSARAIRESQMTNHESRITRNVIIT